MTLSEVPNGWAAVRVSEIVVEIKSGFACAKKNAVESGIPHLRTNNIGLNGELDLTQLTCFPPHLVDLETYDLRAGDVLFNNTNSTELVGKTAIVRKDQPYAFSNHITRLRVNRQLVQPEWLAICLRALWHSGFFERNCRRWIGQAGFSATMLRDVEIPLPPLEEQRRIVARIEALTRPIEEANRLRQAAREQTEKIVPAALAEVFERAEEELERRTVGEVLSSYDSGIWGPKAEHERDGTLILRSTNFTNEGRISFENVA